MADQSPEGIDLSKYLKIVKRRRWTILVPAIISAAAALAFSLLTASNTDVVATDQTSNASYAATTEVLIRPVTVSEATSALGANLLTEKEIISSLKVAEQVAQESGFPPADELLSALVVEVVEGSEILSIQYTTSDPESASAIADAFAETYIRSRTREALALVGAERRSVAERILQVDLQRYRIGRELARAQNRGDRVAVRGALSERSLVVARLIQLQDQLLSLSSERVRASGPSIVSPAATEVVPPAADLSGGNRSSPARNTAVGFLLGLLLGAVLAALQEQLDDRFHSETDLNAASGVPIVGVVPHSSADHEVSSHFAAIRVKVETLMQHRSTKVFLVTSTSSGDGKTFTVLNLGKALVEAGHPVLFVSGDRGHRDLDPALGASPGEGVGDLLGATSNRSLSQHVQRLTSLPADMIPAGASTSPFNHQALEGLFRELAEREEIVLIDSASLTEPDTQLFVAQGPTVLLVVDAPTTTQTDVAHALTELGTLHGDLGGVVLNRYTPD